MRKCDYLKIFCIVLILAAPAARAAYHEQLPADVMQAPVSKPTQADLEAQQRQAPRLPGPPVTQEAAGIPASVGGEKLPAANSPITPQPETQGPETTNAALQGPSANSPAIPAVAQAKPQDNRPVPKRPWSDWIAQGMLVAVGLFAVMAVYVLYRGEKEKGLR